MNYRLRGLMIVVTLICVAFGVPILIMAVVHSHAALSWSPPPTIRQIPFDPEAWRRADRIENHRTVRSQMVDQLIESGRLDGLKREEVENLLGSPLGNMESAGVDGARWDMAYHLGLERAGIPIDEEFLVIRFDAKGCVAEYRIVPN